MHVAAVVVVAAATSTVLRMRVPWLLGLLPVAPALPLQAPLPLLISPTSADCGSASIYVLIVEIM